LDNARFQAVAHDIRQRRGMRPSLSTYSALNLDIVHRKPTAVRSVAQRVDLQSLAAEVASRRAGKSKARSSSSDTKTSAPNSDEEVSDSSPGGSTCFSSPTGVVLSPTGPVQPVPFKFGARAKRLAWAGESNAHIVSSRSFLLGYRELAETPEGIQIRAHEVVPTTPKIRSRVDAELTNSSWRTGQPDRALPSPSEKAYRVRANSSDDLANFGRSMRSLLNKVCPENVATVAEKVISVKIQAPEELHFLIQLLFKKALAEPHYCETYADLVFALKSAFQEFPSPEGGKPVTFRSSLLNAVQAEFEDLHATEGAGDAEDLGELEQARKSRALANMKFIGHLFLRHLLPVRVVGSLVRALLLCDDVDHIPSVVAVECACELLMAVGFTLESSALPIARQAIQESCVRLNQLKNAGDYCKRIQFVIQDVLEARGNGWTRKLFRSSAKTMEEVRLEQQRDLSTQGASSPGLERVVAGQRPGYLTAHM
jgi:hypothetical protein